METKDVHEARNPAEAAQATPCDGIAVSSNRNELYKNYNINMTTMHNDWSSLQSARPVGDSGRRKMVKQSRYDAEMSN